MREKETRAGGSAAPAGSELPREVSERLSREIAAHEATLRELQSTRTELEERVADRTKELAVVKARFETALRGAKVYLFAQDKDLRYTWAYMPQGEEAAARIVGSTDEDLLLANEHASVMALKREVLRSGVSAHCEVQYVLPEGQALVALHIDPSYAADGTIDGLLCAAIDISRTRNLESEQLRLAEQLAAAVQRYETALRGSAVTVFTQDRDLRYTSISNPFLGKREDEIVGMTDDDFIPAESQSEIMPCKREAIETGESRDCEVQILDGEIERWFDLHIEPLRDLNGDTIGITCAAVDVTDRKESEAHLRLLLRELTHRSKNLLAVIQAMARQTARRAGSADEFLDRFSARLQALAVSHDLLVQESWHGASLHDLVRLQLGHHLDRDHSQISFEGPPFLLKPEAAQALGLGLHELATNASKYGALSTQAGKVEIQWRRMSAADGHGIEIVWRERGGPLVEEPAQRGFGSTVIERHLANSLDGEVALTFPKGGVECRITIPVSQFVAGRLA